MASRLEKFRDYMSRLDASADPIHAFEQGFYVEPPGPSLVRRIAALLELEPSSTHFLFGGVGSGKTTQLIAIQNHLSKITDTASIYLDVSQMQDLSHLKPGTLVALAGLKLCNFLGEELINKPEEKSHINTLESFTEKFTKWAYGKWVLSDLLEDTNPAIDEWVEGVVTPPGASFDRNIQEMLVELRKICEIIANRLGTPHVVLLIDSLDRVPDPEIFQKIVSQDVAALSSVGIGLVLVGSLQAAYSVEQPNSDHFDHTHYQTIVDIHRNKAGRDFLLQVLRRRVPEELLSDTSCELLVSFSGGVLRDLITITKLAVGEAYVQGKDQVAREHITAAVDRFGRSLFVGLGPKEIEVLQKVRASGSFVQTSKRDLSLLLNRCILEYRDGPLPLYAVHPTLVHLLKQISDQPAAKQ